MQMIESILSYCMHKALKRSIAQNIDNKWNQMNGWLTIELKLVQNTRYNLLNASLQSFCLPQSQIKLFVSWVLVLFHQMIKSETSDVSFVSFHLKISNISQTESPKDNMVFFKH